MLNVNLIRLCLSLCLLAFLIPANASATPEMVSIGGSMRCQLNDDAAVTCFDQANAKLPVPNYRYADLSVGEAHACALTTLGTLKCWGDNSQGQATPPTGYFQSVAAGYKHACAQRASGKVECWGSNEHGQLEVPEHENFTALSTGTTHSCGINEDHVVRCWGEQPMYPKPKIAKWWLRWFPWLSTPKPKPHLPKNKYKEVAAGNRITCGITHEARVVCTPFGEVEVEQEPAGSFVKVSVGNDFACASSAAGITKCWSTAANALPAQNPRMRIDSLSVGSQRACGLSLATGGLTCWPSSSAIDEFHCESQRDFHYTGGQCDFIPAFEYSRVFDSLVRRPGIKSESSRYFVTTMIRSIYRILNGYSLSTIEEEMAHELADLSDEARQKLVERILVLRSASSQIQSKYVIPELFALRWEHELDFFAMADLIQERPGHAIGASGECSELETEMCGKVQDVGSIPLAAGVQAWARHPDQNSTNILLALGYGGLANVNMAFALSDQMSVLGSYTPMTGGAFDIDMTDSAVGMALVSTWDGEASSGSVELLDYSSAFAEPTLLGAIPGRFLHGTFDDSGDYFFAYNADSSSLEMYRTDSVIAGDTIPVSSYFVDQGQPLDIDFGQLAGSSLNHVFLAYETSALTLLVEDSVGASPELQVYHEHVDVSCEDFGNTMPDAYTHFAHFRTSGLSTDDGGYVWSAPYKLRQFGASIDSAHCGPNIYGALTETSEGHLAVEVSRGVGVDFCEPPHVEIFNKGQTGLELVGEFSVPAAAGVLGTINFANGTQLLFVGDNPALTPCTNALSPKLRTYILPRSGLAVGGSLPIISTINDIPAGPGTHQPAATECGAVPHACAPQDIEAGVCCGGSGYCGEFGECLYPPTVDVSNPNMRLPLGLTGYNFWDVNAVVQISDRIESCSAGNFLNDSQNSGLSWIELGPGFVEGGYDCGDKDKMSVALWDESGSPRLALENGLRFVRVMQCVDESGNLELCNYCSEDAIFSDPVLVNLQAKQASPEPMGYKLMAMAMRAVESTNDQNGWAPTDEVVVNHLTWSNNSAQMLMSPNAGDDHFEMDDGDVADINILLASASDVVFPVLALLEEDSYSLAGVIVGAVAVAVAEYLAVQNGVVTEVEVQAAIAAMYGAIYAIFEALGDSDQISLDAGRGLELNRTLAKSIIRYGEECIPESWWAENQYSHNSVSSVELGASGGHQEAVITKRYVSKEEEGNEGTPAIYEVEYLLIEDGLPFGQ